MLNALVFMNMIIGVIIDVIIESNDEKSPENIRLLNEINNRILKIEESLKQK